MAMRPRGGGGGSATTPNGTRAGGGWPVFEEFEPMSDWQQDDESHTLSLYLPGFVKKQIKVTTEGRNIIRVRGERPIVGNKWIRFLEDFQVPENSEMKSARAGFQGGVLCITIPKKSIVHKPHEPTLPPKPSTTGTDPNQPDPQKGRDKVPPPFVSDDKTSEPDQKKSSIDTTETNDLNKRTLEKEDQNSLKSNELPKDHETAAEEENDNESKQKQMETSRAENGASVMEKYKNAVKGLAELNEERQLLVNMGVAVLVIVAIGAYATYKFTSGKDSN